MYILVHVIYAFCVAGALTFTLFVIYAHSSRIEALIMSIFLHAVFSSRIRIFVKVEASLLASPFWPETAAAGPNSCAAQGSGPRPCMFPICTGIYMSPELQAHEWAPVCRFCFDVTSSARVGHTR